MKYLLRIFSLVISLTLVYAITSNTIIAQDDQELSNTSSQTASIRTRVINNSNSSLEGIEFLCNESNTSGAIINSFTFRTDRNGTFVWEPVVNENSIYSCNAISGFPDCYVPASNSHQSFTITDLVGGEVRNNTLLWVFDPSQPVDGSTCGDLQNPKDPGEAPAEISTITIPSEYSVSPFLGNLSEEDAQSVRDLTITYVGSESSFSCSYLFANNSVQWLRSVNLNDPEVINFFKNLSDNITLDAKGLVRLNVNNISELNRSRRIYLNNLNLNSSNSNTPTILIDDIEAHRNTISNISYTDSTISFVVEGGTDYVFLPTINLTECSPRSLRSGECAFDGQVDALCSSLVLEVSNNDNTDTYDIDLEPDGSFEYQVIDLNPDSNYKFKLIATVHNDQSNYYEWEISELSRIFSQSLILVILVLLVIVFTIVFFVNKKKKEKQLLERREALSNNIEKLINNVKSFTQEVKDRYKMIDLNNNKHVGKALEILKLNESVEELDNYVKESERKEVEEKVTYPIDDIEEKYLELHNRFEKFKKDLIEEAAIKTVSSEDGYTSGIEN